MKTKILLLNAKWVLTNTVRNFVSFVSQTCNKQWENTTQPLKPAIANDNPQELLKQLQARWDKKQFNLEPYVLLSAKYGHLDCIKTLFEFAKEKTPDTKIRALDALNESVIQCHNECAAYLLPHVVAKWQYEAFRMSLENHNHEFIHIFLNTLEIPSPRWNFVVDTLEQHHGIPILCASQSDRLEQIIPYMSDQQRTVCQDFLAQQQRQRIAQHVDVISDQAKKKKM